MTKQEHIQYSRIADAIAYIHEHFKEQPSLEEIAAKIHLSPFHFQKLFTDWAGVSPKQFLQYISLNNAKRLLKEQQVTLFDAAIETGLSGTGRLHDLFINIEGMTPGEYKNGGQDLVIQYSFAPTLFGPAIIANTTKGICYLAFYGAEEKALYDLQQQFLHARLIRQDNDEQDKALRFLNNEAGPGATIKLHLKGSDFQLKVWEALLKIPEGKLSTYAHIAQHIERPKAARAVGTAIGSNPVAFLIPCHRVIQSTGVFGGYMWGPERKTAIIGWEAAAQDRKQQQ